MTGNSTASFSPPDLFVSRPRPRPGHTTELGTAARSRVLGILVDVTSELSSPSGIDLSYLDDAVRVQDDLFAHVNGKWLDDYTIPADRAVDGAFRTLYDQAELDVQRIIQNAAAEQAAPGTDARKIGDLYSSFMDTEAVAAAGFGPISSNSPRCVRSSIAVVSRRCSAVCNGPGSAARSASMSTPTTRTPTATCCTPPNPASACPTSPTTVRTSSPRSGTSTSRISGACSPWPRPIRGSRPCCPPIWIPWGSGSSNFEKKLAAGHWDVVRRRDAERSYNLMTFAALTAEHPEFDWTAWTEALAESVDHSGPDLFAELVVRQPDYVSAFVRAWSSESLADWQAWAAWRVLRSRAPYLTDAVVEENFDFYGRTLTGAQENRERWKRGVSLVQDLLGESVGKLYVAQHFPPEAKARMVDLVANLQQAYRRNIADLEWMGPDTRKAALAKLEKFTPKIGYPDRWRDYSAVTVDPADLVGNYRSGYIAEHDRDLNKLGGPVDRDEWFMTPQTVNAYYNPGMNEIVFPAAILQPPFFDMNADDAANYGGIGAVIGHEIGHGFDDQGAKYDGDGNMVDWWTDDDRAEFGKRTKALIEQYDVLSPRNCPTSTPSTANSPSARTSAISVDSPSRWRRTGSR